MRHKYEDVTFTTNLPTGIDGYYDHTTDRIYIREGLHPRREISVLTHERRHKYHRHQPLKELPRHHAREISVEDEASRELIPFGALLEAFTSYSNMEAMTNKLGVDAGTLCARMLGLTDIEQTILNMCAYHCVTNSLN